MLLTLYTSGAYRANGISVIISPGLHSVANFQSIWTLHMHTSTHCKWTHASAPISKSPGSNKQKVDGIYALMHKLLQRQKPLWLLVSACAGHCYTLMALSQICHHFSSSESAIRRATHDISCGRGPAQYSPALPGPARHSTAQHSTAQPSPAQHSTAQHSTAQHSTAQHSTQYKSTVGAHLP